MGRMQRFFTGFLLGTIGGVIYDAAAYFFIRTVCTNPDAVGICSFVTRWPVYQSYPLVNLDRFLVKQPFLGIPSYSNINAWGFIIHLEMINTVLWIMVLGGILAVMKQEWGARKIIGMSILAFIGLSLVWHIASLSGCAGIKFFFGEEIQFFACDPPAPGWKW